MQNHCAVCQLIHCQPDLPILYRDDTCVILLRVENQCWLGRFTILPVEHMQPLDFWARGEKVAHLMGLHARFAKAVVKAFGATCVDMIQMVARTRDISEVYRVPTMDPAHHHVHLDAIPRYEVAPVFAADIWPDPQFEDGRFQRLNLDVQRVPVSPTMASLIVTRILQEVS